MGGCHSGDGDVFFSFSCITFGFESRCKGNGISCEKMLRGYVIVC